MWKPNLLACIDSHPKPFGCHEPLMAFFAHCQDTFSNLLLSGLGWTKIWMLCRAFASWLLFRVRVRCFGPKDGRRPDKRQRKSFHLTEKVDQLQIIMIIVILVTLTFLLQSLLTCTWTWHNWPATHVDRCSFAVRSTFPSPPIKSPLEVVIRRGWGEGASAIVGSK